MFSRHPDYFLTVEGDSMDRLGLTTGTLAAIKLREEALKRALHPLLPSGANGPEEERRI